METSAEKVSRLMRALETLSDQEYCLLIARDYTGVIVIQDRCQPVIDEISRLMLEPGLASRLHATTRTRVDEWLIKQTDQLARLAADKTAAHQDLQLLGVAQSRNHLFRSAYGCNNAGPAQPSTYAEAG